MEPRTVVGPLEENVGPFLAVAQAAPLSKLKTWLDSANYRNIMSASSTVPFPARYRRLASAKIQRERERGGEMLNGATQLRGNPPIRGFPASAFRASAFPLIGPKFGRNRVSREQRGTFLSPSFVKLFSIRISKLWREFVSWVSRFREIISVVGDASGNGCSR